VPVGWARGAVERAELPQPPGSDLIRVSTAEAQRLLVGLVRPGWPGRGFWLLARRRLPDGELAFYACFGPARTTLAELVGVAGIRGAVEECFQAGKGQVGLDHYQVRRYDAWYRHTTLALVAQAFLAAVRAQAARNRPVGKGGS